MVDDLSSIEIGILADWLRDTDSWLWVQSSQPLAVDIDAVLDGFVFLQRQREAKTNDVHAPLDLLRVSVRILQGCQQYWEHSPLHL